MPVNQHQHLSCTGTDASEVDASCRTSRHAISHDASACEHESWNLLHDGRKNRCLILVGKCFPVDNGYCHWQMAHIRGIPCPSDNHFVQRQRVFLCINVCSAKERYKNRKSLFHKSHKWLKSDRNVYFFAKVMIIQRIIKTKYK